MKVLNLKAYSKRIEEIKEIYEKTAPGIYLIEVQEDGTITEGDNTYESLNEIKSPWFTSDKAKIFIEDFISVPDGIYLPSEPLLWWVDTSAERKVFIDLNKANKETEWMQLYIKLIKRMFHLVEKGEVPFGCR